MKINLLSLILFSCLCLPNMSHAQLLTPLPDTIDYASPDTYNRGVYFFGGFGLGALTSGEEMRALKKNLGFDQGRLYEMFSTGIGARWWDRYYLELGTNVLTTDPDDVQLRQGKRVELQEVSLAFNLLLGYRFWQNQRTGLVLWAGGSSLNQALRITERQRTDFNFDDFSTGSTEDVRTWPTFTHEQGALHLALEWRSRPRSRTNPNNIYRLGHSSSGVSSDWSIRLGYIRGLQTKAWSVDYGTVSNAPVDVGEYLYLSASIDISYNYRRK